MKQSIILLTVGVSLIWLLQASIHSYMYSQIGIRLINRIDKPYEQKGNGKKIIVLGDSAAYGTGASKPENSFAGIAARNCHDCSVVNYGKNGLKTESLLAQINKLGDLLESDQIYMLIGSNDIMHFYVNLNKSCENLELILNNITAKTNRVVLLTSPDASYAKFFSIPLNYFYGARGHKLNKCASNIAQNYETVSFIDLEANYNRELLEEHQAEDGLHMNDAGNLYWYQLSTQRN